MRFTPAGVQSLLPFMQGVGGRTVFANPLSNSLTSSNLGIQAASTGVATSGIPSGAIDGFTTKTALLLGGPVPDPLNPPPYVWTPTLPEGTQLFSAGAYAGSLAALAAHTAFVTGQDTMMRIISAMQNCVRFKIQNGLSFPFNINPNDDPCLALIRNALGSVMGTGGKLLGSAIADAAGIVTAIQNGSLERQITQFTNKMDNHDRTIKNMINSEIAAIEDCMRGALTVAAMNLIPNLFKDPCMREIFNMVGVPDFTQAVRKAVQQIPHFPMI